ncbi:hypothetical protein ACIBCT_31610 [Streptosporangium sp. NPDC050855]|uniref:hypothetical protein n=1 Tax=Streptosporangium sp. NPDC050855 TaxID=3366194 RepID=UPI0037BA69CD
MPEGRFYRRGHWVRKRGSKGRTGSGWLMLALLAGAVFLWSQVFDGGQEAPPPSPPAVETAGPDEVPPPEPTTDPADEPPPPEPTGEP